MRTYLSNGYRIKTEQNRAYTIVSMFGEGASCVAYFAIDEQTNAKCVLKEYYPAYISITRDESGRLFCDEHESDKFQRGIERFNGAVNTQVELRNTDGSMNQIFYIIDRFDANGTSYVVVPQYNGCTYSNNEDISLYDRIRTCRSVINYVIQCHSGGYLCLDIKPDNIFVIPETSELAMFFDFDSICRFDEAISGMNLSYTSNWAAPEQIIPGGNTRISVESDIYVLGELIYWSIFDRHSSDNEHRSHSVFLFSDSKFRDVLSTDAEDILSEIFHHTLRSSVRNRYHSAAELLQKVDDLLVEIYPGKESLISVYPNSTTFFVGRGRELDQIEQKLSEGHLAVLSGVGGIGKSEIAKQYVDIHKDKYKAIIYLTYSFDIVSTINQSEFLTDFEQKDEESDLHYCNRKINKLSELFSGKNLIVVDNLNIEIEEMQHLDIWKRICSLPCDLLITTRCNQEQYYGNQIYVDGMDIDNLKAIFLNHCGYEPDQNEYVESIIKSVQYHTLVVELIAKQANSCLMTPYEMLTLLNNKGILGFDSENVKWDFKKKTVADHVRGLFSVFEISKEQKELLFIMAFMPVSGIDEALFFEFFKLENHNDLRHLIDNGWISESEGVSRKIFVHPVITSVVMDVIKNDLDYANKLYTIATESMLRWYKREDINQEEFFHICHSLALQTCEYQIVIHSAADFIIRYNSCFVMYGNSDERRSLILYAINIYNAIYPETEYAAVREAAYKSYISSINDIDHYEEVKRECKKHLGYARKNKDYYMQSQWYLLLNNASHVRNSMNNGFSLMYIVYYYKILFVVLKLQKESQKAKTRILTEDNLERLHYGYMKSWLQNLHEMVYLNLASCCEQLSEESVFFTKNIWFETNGYKQAIGIRSRYKNAQTINATGNSIYKHIDEAKLLVLARDYAAADDILTRIISYFEEHEIPANTNLYTVHFLVAMIALTTEDYEKAIQHYNECLEIAGKLGYRKNYGIRVGLARALLFNGDIEESNSINYQLYVDLKEVEKDNRGTSFAEMYYNTACRHCALGDKEQAEKFFLHAISQFNSCSIYGNQRSVGIARCKYQLGELIGSEQKERAASYYSQAYEEFSSCLGSEHIETRRCHEKLNKFKSYLQKK